MIAASVAAALSLLLPGCVSREAADPRRTDRWSGSADGTPQAERLPSDAWPPRQVDDLDRVLTETPDVIAIAGQPEARIRFKGKFGVGIIRTVREWRRWQTRFVSYSTLPDRPYDERAQKWLQNYVKGQPHNTLSLEPQDRDAFALFFEGTQIRVLEPQDRRPIGLVVHLPGLGTSDYERPVIDELLKRGWAVLRIAPPGVWWLQSKPIFITREDQIEPTAERVARIIDDLVAEPAYATEAALEYVQMTRPRLPQTPVVLLGFSAGALSTPTVFARMPEKFDAAVIVGGGADLLMLSQTSDLTDGGVRVAWLNELGTAAQRQRLYESYLRHSRLDPYHAARTMLDKPVLLVQAALDSTVQASGGDLLWERLARPERWVFSGGHRLLFWRLADQAVPIADWIEKAAFPSDAHAAAAARSAPAQGVSP